jgi:hypothetical protein
MAISAAKARAAIRVFMTYLLLRTIVLDFHRRRDRSASAYAMEYGSARAAAL